MFNVAARTAHLPVIRAYTKHKGDASFASSRFLDDLDDLDDDREPPPADIRDRELPVRCLRPSNTPQLYLAVALTTSAITAQAGPK